MIDKIYIRTRPGVDISIDGSTVRNMLSLSDYLKNVEIINSKDEIDENTLILSLGGDGTMLSSIRFASETNSYVVGFNYGHLGYLTHPAPPEYLHLVNKVNSVINSVNVDGFGYESFNLKLPLLTTKFGNQQKIITKAVNDVFVIPAANGSSMNFHVSVDGVEAFETRSSGVVVSTPIGSTGLALSAGGSVLSPNSKVFQIVPMLPHTLTSRPLIVPDSSIINISWGGDDKANVRADGLMTSDNYVNMVTLKKSQKPIKMIHPVGWNFYENLRNKMKWNT